MNRPKIEHISSIDLFLFSPETNKLTRPQVSDQENKQKMFRNIKKGEAIQLTVFAGRGQQTARNTPPFRDSGLYTWGSCH
jgi:hypothetical protein